MIGAMLRLSLVLLVACGPKTSAPANPDQAPLGSGAGPTPTGEPIAATPDATLPFDRDYPRIVEAAIAMYGDLHAALAATTDCAVATTALGTVQTKYADLIAANAAIAREGRIAELKTAMAPREDQFAAAARAVMELPVLPACAKDTAFTRAFGRFTGA